MVKKKKVEELIDKIYWEQFNGAIGFLICEKMNKTRTYKVDAISCIIESGILIIQDPSLDLNSPFLIKDIENIETGECFRIVLGLDRSISITTLY